MLLIHNALLNGLERGWLAADGEFIISLGSGDAPQALFDASTEIVDASGMMLLPGAIDTHVHFREPGLTHKASIASESHAALSGGVTSYIEMPNTVPPTTTLDAWRQKMEIGAERSEANYAFMLGATADNICEIRRADPRQMPAVKVFMGSSTGNLLIDEDRVLAAVFSDQPFRVVVHAEDQSMIASLTARYGNSRDIAVHSKMRPAEVCVRATERAMNLATRYGTRLHIAHVSTGAEVTLFDAGPLCEKQITAEVSPHHLTFITDDYAVLGARIKMNPSVKSAADRSRLHDGVVSGRIDTIATDHAPHLLSEKEGPVGQAVSGAPMIQFSLPLMLDMFDVGTVISRMCSGPAELFGIDRRGTLRPGYYADLVLVERLSKPHIVTDADVVSLCGWTPLTGRALHHAVRRVWVNGGKGAKALAFV